MPFTEFAGDRRLLWIAEEWQRYSEQLAEWAMQRLVNRRDVWSQYTVKNGQVGVVMLPIKERRHAGTDMVTINKLRRHFAGRAVSHLIGLHSISDHRTCKWFAIDIDLHDEDVPNADEIALANRSAALAWSRKLREQYAMDPLLFDSNGVGGYHIWTLLDDEYPLADVFDFVDEMRSDWELYGLPRKPEIFPPKREVDDDDLPYGLRVPGRHHYRSHYSRVYNFDRLDDAPEWLEGGDAIEAMLAARPAALPKLNKSKRKAAVSARVAKKPCAKAGATPAPRAKRPRVCLDLDGVLAGYDRWRGPEHIGAPLPGAVEFAHSLAEFADIVIFTSRCSADAGSDRDPGKMRILIVDWLERHGIPYADVYVGQGKPHAAAFIDDRAVACTPQLDDEAFDKALVRAREVVFGTHRASAAVSKRPASAGVPRLAPSDGRSRRPASDRALTKSRPPR
ncbi:MAG: hypothetical protein ACK4S4_04050 [Pyrinomonadaceae bacterium]